MNISLFEFFHRVAVLGADIRQFSTCQNHCMVFRLPLQNNHKHYKINHKNS